MKLIPILANKVWIIPAKGWPLGTLNALLRFVMCERSSSVQCWYNHPLNCKLGGQSAANRCAFREKSYGCNRSSWKTPMVLRCNSQFSCDIARATTTPLSFHSCNYGISNGWCLEMTRGSVWIYKSRSWHLHFLSHGHYAAIVETHQRLEDVVHGNCVYSHAQCVYSMIIQRPNCALCVDYTKERA
jgi:hypothetical protein